jgi:hypothetical protein
MMRQFLLTSIAHNACALGLGTPDTGGGFIVGASLILLGVL